MSDFYEGIVTVGQRELVSSVFHSIRAQRRMRLVRFADRTYGIYPVASRSERINAIEIDNAAIYLSKTCSQALVVLYDNRVGLRVSKLFREGELECEFGELDEKWLPLDEKGEPDVNQPILSADELNPDDEYECTQDAISLGLAKLGVLNSVTSSDLKQAFCYNEGEVVAESKAE